MAALRTAKTALRKEIKRRVAALSDEEKQRQSLVISQKLFRHPKYASCKRIAVFLNMDDEVRTEEIIKDVFKWGKSCFIPRYKSRSSHMDMLKLSSLQDIEMLPLTSWNIRQPAEEDNSREEALATGGLDLILVPGLGFDRLGKRLGRGKGFYDTYLGRCIRQPKGKPYTIALAFKEQLCQEIPIDNNDVLVDEVLYEDEE
ncbi:5,10-methenyltetrahydrofolate synthetase (5-formyltetrahydrofolate cyclo-ligase) isoform X1 [Micropterus salmoides]|uniref:5,10-methenyltetrahydrofolate synthetase (5-formyltetrahydrofolate cyclo-ligase) isoform X1 n=2 Tax=Micropterus salmoides TaxID=27706 RepID=UPI0018EAA743|nr:5,10-methenyltetrahydrofolate synthetase (5-formyltetrahydrofolate cyclo-ligase) isoform X1 [Micropterus salmoides]